MSRPRRPHPATDAARRRVVAEASAPRAYTIRVTALGPDGHGRAIHEGEEISVANVVPGEVVEIVGEPGGAARREGRGPARATLLRVVEASPHRVVPRCQHALVCGGCRWQHIAYAEQRRLKQVVVREALERALGAEAPPVGDVMAPDGQISPDAPTPWAYRQKVTFVCTTSGRGALSLGHFAEGGQTVIPVVECPVHATAGNAASFAIRDLCNEVGVPAATTDGRRGILRHVVARVGFASGEVVVTLVVTNARDGRLARVTRAMTSGRVPVDGLHVNVLEGESSWLFGRRTIKLAGRSRVREEVQGVSFLIEPTAFFQTNVPAARTLVRLVLEAMPAARCHVLDVYAGVGLFALPLARAGHDVVAIEAHAGAVEAGRRSQQLNDITDARCRFVCARVEDALARAVRRRHDAAGTARRPLVAIVDPPRAGCSPRVVERLARDVAPDVLVYVSCEPRALGRDLAHFLGAARREGHEYQVQRVQPVDMFPHTPHVETVAVLRRSDAPRHRRGPARARSRS